jgi:hypothetical protein
MEQSNQGRYYTSICLAELRKTKKRPQSGTLPLGKDLNIGHYEYETQVLTTHPWHSAIYFLFVTYEINLLTVFPTTPQ